MVLYILNTIERKMSREFLNIPRPAEGAPPPHACLPWLGRHAGVARGRHAFDAGAVPVGRGAGGIHGLRAGVARQDVRQGCRRCGAGPPDRALRPEGTGRSPRRAGWRASWTASCHPPRSRPSPCQRSAGAMPGIAGLYGQPPAGPQLAGHAAAHRLSSRPAARAEANRLTRHEIDAMKR